MRRTNLALAAVATMPFAAAIAFAPMAFGDTCDPAVTVCEGDDVQPGPASIDASPPVEAQYPDDEDWYFDPAGGGTALQPAHPSGGAPAGGGHR